MLMLDAVDHQPSPTMTSAAPPYPLLTMAAVWRMQWFRHVGWLLLVPSEVALAYFSEKNSLGFIIYDIVPQMHNFSPAP